ncbi:uncharacterized protein TNCV_2850611 [Trichonephila clavipes]|nr:uncharacterized protein TNCV_2850611 [Trichonephila clavipes]
MSSSPTPLMTRRVGELFTLNLSRAQTTSRWCEMVVRRGGCQLKCRPGPLIMIQNCEVCRQKPSSSKTSRRIDEEGHFNSDDEDHFLGIDAEDGHEDEEPLPPLALPLQNGRCQVPCRVHASLIILKLTL